MPAGAPRRVGVLGYGGGRPACRGVPGWRVWIGRSLGVLGRASSGARCPDLTSQGLACMTMLRLSAHLPGIYLLNPLTWRILQQLDHI